MTVLFPKPPYEHFLYLKGQWKTLIIKKSLSNCFFYLQLETVQIYSDWMLLVCVLSD